MASDDSRPEGELLVYQAADLGGPLTVRLEEGTVWLCQKQLEELCGTSIANINKHIATVYEQEELPPAETVKKYLIVQTEGSLSRPAVVSSLKVAANHFEEALDMVVTRMSTQTRGRPETSSSATVRKFRIVRNRPLQEADTTYISDRNASALTLACERKEEGK